ncbi:MAG: LysR family transcriptional regulator [Paracoccaceae bacterium]|nr:LysR family transcriptional regulator [Paracoccaceae bacterium]
MTGLEMRIFRTVVETGGFSSAAHSLGTSQPFVNQTIHSLEAPLRAQAPDVAARSTK